MAKDPLLVKFYQTAAGHMPVLAWLRSLPKEQRRELGEAIKEVAIGWPLGMPLVRKLERSIWEIRASIPPQQIARILFAIRDVPATIVLLHGFIKKTQKTPTHELATARERLKRTIP